MKNIGLFFTCFIALLIVGCANSSLSGPSAGGDLLEKLASINGAFSWNDSQNIFTYNKRVEMEKVIEGRNIEETLRILVNNIDNDKPSNSLMNGKKVALGVVCYTAITQIAYYEAIADDGDVAENWEGYISPNATMEELSNARKAWQKILESHLYILL